MEHFKIWSTSDKNIGHFTRRNECVVGLLLATTGVVQEERKRIAALHGYAFNAYYIIDSNICTSTIEMALIVAFT